MRKLFLVSLGLLVLFVNTANGQNYGPTVRASDCLIYEDQYVVILDLSCDTFTMAVSWYVSEGYEIKDIIQNPAQPLMFLQKDVIK